MPVAAPSATDTARSFSSAIPLGNTPLTTSRLGFGTHALHWLFSSRARGALLSQAYELGVRFFDTAPCYGEGIAEREIARLASGRRATLVLTTKFGIPASPLAASIPGGVYLAKAASIPGRVLRRGRFEPPRDFSAAGARRSVEGSLRRLKTDHVDILYLHAPAPAQLTDIEALGRALSDLKTAGKVRYIGLSGEPTNCLAIARAHPTLAEVLQLEVPAEPVPTTLPDAPAHSVRLWEPPGESAEPFAASLTRLRDLTPNSVVLISTRREEQLREAARIFS